MGCSAPGTTGKFVAIDVIGGAYAVAGDEEEAFTRVSERAEPDTLF